MTPTLSQKIRNDENIIDNPGKIDDSFDIKEVALIQSDEENHVENTDDGLDIQIEEMIEKKEGLWECKVCGKTAKLKGNLKNHEHI